MKSVLWHSALCCVGSSQFQIIPGSSRNNELFIEGTVKAEQHWGENAAELMKKRPECC